MMHLIPKTNIDFLKYRGIYFTLMAILFIAGGIVVGVKGLNLGIDFTGGTMVQVQFHQPVDMSTLRQALSTTGESSEIQSYPDNAFAIREKSTASEVGAVQARIEEALQTMNAPFTIIQTNAVGPAVGSDMSERALWAILLSLVFIIIYVGFRFNNILWGAAGVLGLFHDLFVMVVAFALTQREIDLVIVAAFLTVAGYSINDTIVIFDRMRENIRLFPKKNFREIINLSINETLSRTIITSMTVISALIVLFFFGGEVLNNFAFAMLIGCITGVYSTVALTSPLIFAWTKGQLSESGLVDKKPTIAKEPATLPQQHAASAQPAGKVVTKIKRTRKSK